MQDQLEVIKEKIKSYGLNRENMRDLKKWILNDFMNGKQKGRSMHPCMNNNGNDYWNGYKQRSLLTTDGKVILDKSWLKPQEIHLNHNPSFSGEYVMLNFMVHYFQIVNFL